MKTISDLKIDEEAIVQKILAKEPVKGRLLSMGIVKGAKVKVVAHTLARQTWDILSNNTKVALREEEAHSIVVKGLHE
ncbi:MAG: ferrous iron transport protein A [Campylobacteraceae bacterium]|nr:ferrous iron transport protein A [Campylobacteraceae bacterium]